MNEETMELKIYTPLMAHYAEDGPEFEDEDCSYDGFDGWQMDGHDLIYYEDVIREAIAKEQLSGEEKRGLMKYFYGRDPSSVDEKVLSAFPDVEAYDGKLWGVLKCQIKEPLTAQEFAALADYWTGQASDGWGEGFEQRPLRVDGGEIYVHFWHSGDDYRTMSEKELKTPKSITPKKNRKHSRDAR